MKQTVACVVAVFFSFLLQSQTADSSKSIVKPAKTPAELLKEFENIEKGNKDTGLLANGPVSMYQSDKRLDSVQLEAWKSYFTYMSTGYKHRANVFSWQLVSSKIIFTIVILLVLTGIYFAWLQFKMALKKIQQMQEKAAESLVTELTASMKEVKVSSPVLGVIILIISLLFFYLYLMFVYPITEIF